MGPARQLALLAVIVLAALGLRFVGVADVWLPDGSIALETADGSYHARRAFYTFARFPAALHADPLLAHPGGAWVPWPPLWDWLLGALGALLAGSERGFARLAAVASPAVGALTCAALFAAGRALAGPAVGLGAAALFAALPMAAVYAGVGNPDHHAAVALAVTGYAGLSLALCRERAGAGAVLALGGVRAALAAAWNGSLLVLVVGEGALLGAALWNGRADLLRRQAWGAGLAAAALAAGVAAWGAPPDRAWTAATLSWLHPVALLAVAALAAACAAAEARRPAAGRGARLGRAAGIGAALAAAGALLLPGLAGELAAGLGFLGATDVWALGNPEQQPLWSFARGHVDALALWGPLAWLLPVPILAAGLCRRTVPDPAARGVLALWTAPLGALALLQVRFGNEAAPVLCLALAVLAAEAARRLGPRGAARGRPGSATRGLPGWAARGLPALLLAAAVLPATWRYHAPRVDRDRWLLAGPGRGVDPLLTTGPGSLVRFARDVRALTPETRGFTDADARPAYGVLAPPSAGHVLHWEARRATPADNFGPWLDPARFAAVQRFYATSDADEALALAAELDARYVVTDAATALRAGSVAGRLHRHHGATAPGSPRLDRFRLVMEGPAGGRGFADWGPAAGEVPWKLFEVVPGARVVVPAAEGAPVELRLELETDLGTRFVYFARARGGADGRARLRVPYSTEPGARVRAGGPARLTRAGVARPLAIPEAAVRSGGEVLVPAEEAPPL